jgi:hypothetical protein
VSPPAERFGSWTVVESENCLYLSGYLLGDRQITSPDAIVLAVNPDPLKADFKRAAEIAQSSVKLDGACRGIFIATFKIVLFGELNDAQ